MFRNIE